MSRLFPCVLITVAMAIAPLSAQTQEFDLLIKGGHVIDPKNGINAVMDVAVSGSKIALVAANIAPARARQVVQAGQRREVFTIEDLKVGQVGHYRIEIELFKFDLVLHQKRLKFFESSDIRKVIKTSDPYDLQFFEVNAFDLIDVIPPTKNNAQNPKS